MGLSDRAAVAELIAASNCDTCDGPRLGVITRGCTKRRRKYNGNRAPRMSV